jgi:hypothetical protein
MIHGAFLNSFPMAKHVLAMNKTGDDASVYSARPVAVKLIGRFSQQPGFQRRTLSGLEEPVRR